MSSDTTILTESMNEAVTFCADKTRLQGRGGNRCLQHALVRIAGLASTCATDWPKA
jgi:hypothetical protein